MRICLIAVRSRETAIGIYATSPFRRFFTDLYGDAARSGILGHFTCGLGGWPVGGGSDMTAQIAPAGCLMRTSALAASAYPLTGTLFDVITAVFFRKAFTFTAVLTDFMLAM